MKKDLLVCIAFHYAPERLKYLHSVLANFINTYEVSLDIIIDTNSDTFTLLDYPADIKIVSHTHLEHPFHLTGMHRQHIKDNIDNYENFYYVEDDELLPYENYLNYLENFKALYPKYVPSFVRIEVKDEVEYISDIPEKQPLEIIEVGGKQFNAFKFPINYCGMWIMPQKELKGAITEDFTKLSDGREFNAMFVGWGLQKPALVEIENGLISKKCYSYHLPNNYALSEGTPNGKIKPENIFR